MKENSTKQKILKMAHKLFADKGLAGVSIRELAKECDVNIAAINYHFENKENLYIQTMIYCIEEMEEGVRKVFEADGDSSLEIFVLSIFDYFVQNSKHLKTSFKFVVSSNHFHMVYNENKKEVCGPPGGEFLEKVIQQKYPKALKEDVGWAVRVLFAEIIHQAIIRSNESLCKSLDKNGINSELIQSDLKRLLRVILKELS